MKTSSEIKFLFGLIFVKLLKNGWIPAKYDYKQNREKG